MKATRWLPGAACCLAACLIVAPSLVADDGSGDDVVGLVIEILMDQDKDVRALGLEQVRSEAKGAAATKRFAALLSKLAPDAQVGLLSALADRGDGAARPEVLKLLAAKSDSAEPVRVAAIRSLGPLGSPDDVRLLVAVLSSGSAAEKNAARASLVRLRGESVPKSIVETIFLPPLPESAGQPTAASRVALIEILAARRARGTIPDLLRAALDEDAKVRAAAMVALGQLAGPEQIPDMVKGVLKAQRGRERDAAERAVAQVCGRIKEPARRGDPLLAVFEKLDDSAQTALLPGLGRVGGAKALQVVEEAAAAQEPQRHEAGVRALCNWPDASVAPILIRMATSEEHDGHRTMALKALIRIAPLADGRSDAQRLELLRKTLTMCSRDDDRNAVLKRAASIRTLETLRFVVPYLDQPAQAQQACETIVELAHHRTLRDANKAEFHAALDKVIETSKDPVVVDRANRYKKGQTWVRPAKS